MGPHHLQEYPQRTCNPIWPCVTPQCRHEPLGPRQAEAAPAGSMAPLALFQPKIEKTGKEITAACIRHQRDRGCQVLCMKVAEYLGRRRIGCCRTSIAMCPTGGPNPEDMRPSHLWGDSRLSPKSVNERQALFCLSSAPFPSGAPSEEMSLSVCIHTPQASWIPETHCYLQAVVTASNTCKAAIIGRDEDTERQKKSEIAFPSHPQQSWGCIRPAVPTHLLTNFAFLKLAFLSDNSISFWFHSCNRTPSLRKANLPFSFPRSMVF